MPIEKFIDISNIGRFTNMVAMGNVQFRQATLIYGDNGSGKTTLSGVLRSLSIGDPAFITERATLGAQDKPNAKLLVDGEVVTFKDGTWSKPLPELEIFDDTFITENVYAGDVVDIEQRKNLYQVVVGPIAVKLARRIDELDSNSRACSRQISTIENELRNYIQSPFSFEAFLKLQKVINVEEKISSVTLRLSAARNAKQVVGRPQLSTLSLPDAPREIIPILNTNIAAISENARKQVREHLEHLDRNGESWLKQGLEYVHDETCPFCAQNLQGSQIFQFFTDFFSDEYDKQVILLQRAINQIEQTFSDEVLNRLFKITLENRGHIQTWSDLVDLKYAEIPLDRLESTWRKLRSVLIDALREKLSNPASKIHETSILEAALQDYEMAVKEVRSKNAGIEKANHEIAEVKKGAAGANEIKLEEELRHLRNTQIRQEPKIVELCDQLIAERNRKKTIEIDKTKTKDELSKQAESVLSAYEADINTLLNSFGATFRLKGTRPHFAGGRASSTYNLSVNNVIINVGDSKTPRGIPCFRTALSSGDKSTLALSFFLARLSRNVDIKKKIIVFDDPLTSLDCFRISFTQQEITRLSEEATQAIILSHDPFFLKGIDELLESSKVKTLQLSRKGKTQTIREWDIAQFCLAEAHKDYFILKKFIEEGLPDGGDLRTVVRAIRPYLEGYLRHRYPDRFVGKTMMGEMITAIRDSDSTSELATLKPKLNELEDINTFSRKVHHGSGGSSTAIISENEVETYVKRALTFVRGSA